MPQGNASPSILKRQIVVLYARRNELLMEFRPNTPEVRAIEGEIRALRRELQRQLQAPRRLPPPRRNKWRPEAQLLSLG